MHTALIFGVTGQDGSYLADYLLTKNYKVHGAVRRVSNRLILDKPNMNLIDADITDCSSVSRAIRQIKPDEVYNLAAQSHVAVSFSEPAHTWDVTAKGCLNILEAIRSEHPQAKFFQASSSEMFGGNYNTRAHIFTPSEMEVEIERYQSEDTPFTPCSPYAIAKLAAHNFTQVYRRTYGLFACSGIMFNHESERRGENFVTRKITTYVAKLSKEIIYELGSMKSYFLGKTYPKLKLGNLDVWRDWGYAPDFVEAMHLMLQNEVPEDFVIATGQTHSLKDFLRIAFGHINANWEDHVEIDPKLCRPNEIMYCKGEATKIKKKLSWEPKTKFEDLVKKMVNFDIAKLL